MPGLRSALRTSGQTMLRPNLVQPGRRKPMSSLTSLMWLLNWPQICTSKTAWLIQDSPIHPSYLTRFVNSTPKGSSSPFVKQNHLQSRLLTSLPSHPVAAYHPQDCPSSPPGPVEHERFVNKPRT
ncbi:hypothetical protein DFH28DRAFT_929086 [Melampsora americana]|nr:hypothetical protein DFH28DRAFT_929086 [Melampsora americana]